jgi:ATP-dependent exoDNAse (exonuclease V) beta subunit
VRLAGWSSAELLERQEEELERERAEAVRVAYVAATRARDLLVVPAVGTEPFDSGWIGPLNSAVYPARSGGVWSPPSAVEVAGCPGLGESTVVPALDAGAASSEEPSIAPGRYDFEGGGSAVWFCPRLLKLDAQPLFGIRQERLIGREAAPEVVAADVRLHEQWRAARDDAVAQGARPSLAVQTATARAALPPPLGEQGAAAMPAVEVVSLPASPARPGGKRFGELVHLALSTVELDADRSQVAAATQMHARIIGATEDESAAATDAIEAALRHPLLRRAHAAAARGDCRRETPLTLRDADGTVIDGTVDLAFLENGRWTVVDFKTDRELGRAADVYARQLALYARAITAATGLPAAGVLLRL